MEKATNQRVSSGSSRIKDRENQKKCEKNGDDVDDDDKIASLRTKGSRALLALSAIKYYIRAHINNTNNKNIPLNNAFKRNAGLIKDVMMVFFLVVERKSH